jgi:hypothetical protein
VKIFALIIAGAVAAVAWLQWWVALNKLRLDLFDRRYKVYDATREFLALLGRRRRTCDVVTCVRRAASLRTYVRRYVTYVRTSNAIMSLLLL